jgi:uncharacterized membrane protein HdeD (DUF308 family)
MQESLTKQTVQSEEYHTRLWWMEVARGVITIIFGILIPFTLYILIYVLGIYLVIDGALDIFMLATGRRETHRKFINYLVGIVSIALGLISFVTPQATLFLIVVVISTRIIFRAVKVLIDARRSRHKYEGLTWLYGILLMLFGLALLINAIQSVLAHVVPYSLILIVIFICIYALVDGLYLLVRGLLLRFEPSIFTAPKLKAPQSPADLPADLPPTTRRAIAFVRRPGANGLGHIGWAFEWTNGWFNAGSVENQEGKAFAEPQEMGFWTAHTLNPIAAMQKQLRTYDEYKAFYVTEPRPKDAWKTVVWESREPYSAVRHNCNDVAYDILRAYGTTELPDPVEGLIPNDWYDALPGPSYVIEENPTIPLHLHKISKRELATREIMLAIPPRIQGTPPPWRMNGWRAWQELNDTWDKMLGDVRTLFVSAGKLVTRRPAS